MISEPSLLKLGIWVKEVCAEDLRISQEDSRKRSPRQDLQLKCWFGTIWVSKPLRFSSMLNMFFCSVSLPFTSHNLLKAVILIWKLLNKCTFVRLLELSDLSDFFMFATLNESDIMPLSEAGPARAHVRSLTACLVLKYSNRSASASISTQACTHPLLIALARLMNRVSSTLRSRPCKSQLRWVDDTRFI